MLRVALLRTVMRGIVYACTRRGLRATLSDAIAPLALYFV
jgi:hypothetical protein